jgi:hypothetical protein
MQRDLARWVSLVLGEVDTCGASIILGRGDLRRLKYFFHQFADSL